MILADPSLKTSAIASLAGYLSRRTNVCVQLLDRSGTIVAVSRHGLDLLGRDADGVCGRDWAALWEPASRLRAEAALAAALSGETVSFAGRIAGAAAVAGWEVELFPSDSGETGAASVVAILSPSERPDQAEGGPMDADPAEVLRETLHTISNLATAASSAANILRRGVNPDRARALADHLEESGRRAARTVEDLRRHVPPDRRS